jgi:hypothetical protein
LKALDQVERRKGSGHFFLFSEIYPKERKRILEFKNSK